MSEYDPNFGDDKMCICGHIYERHFDSYDDMCDVGCKYCNFDDCPTFTSVLDEKLANKSVSSASFEALLEKCGISGKFASRTPQLYGLVNLLTEFGICKHEITQLIFAEALNDITKFAPGNHECKLCFGYGGTVENIGDPYVPCKNCKPNV